jgi:large subunit ribosomal protein L25
MSNQPAPTLAAQSRTVIGKAVRQLRREGLLPAVMYGHNIESQSLSLDNRTFTKLFRQVGGSTLIDLAVDDAKPVKVLVHHVQEHPIKRIPEHVDFYIVNLKEKLQTSIPLEFIGVSDAEEVLGGTLNHVKDEVEVECLPQDLVAEIQVDVSSIKTFEDVLRISDIITPKGITILDDAEEVVVSVIEPRSEADMAELDEAPTTTETVVATAEGAAPAPVDAKSEENKKDKK